LIDHPFQFVPLLKYLPSPAEMTDPHAWTRAMARLAKEVLAEIPEQVTSYMKSRLIVPRPPNDPFPADPAPAHLYPSAPQCD
jgi:hypothetical protein